MTGVSCGGQSPMRYCNVNKWQLDWTSPLNSRTARTVRIDPILALLERIVELHYLRWLLFPIKGDTYFMYQGIFDTDFDKYSEDAVALFSATGLDTVFENLEGFPKDWKTKPEEFVKFVREDQCQSFLEYGEYPYVSADEIKKALKLKAAFSNMLDRCSDSPEQRIGRSSGVTYARI